MIVSLVTEKGGTGKTTLAANLAAHWAREGRDVATWDFDPQRSLTSWHERRDASGEPLPAIERHAGDSIATASELERAAAGIDRRGRIVVADTPGSDSLGLRLGMLAADLLVVPLRAGGTDLAVARRMASLLIRFGRGRAEAGAAAPRMGMVFNATRARSTLHREHRRALRRELEGTGVRLLDAAIHEYDDFGWATAQGMGACDFDPSSKAARSVRGLADALLDAEAWSRHEQDARAL